MVDRPVAKALGESLAIAMKRKAQIASRERCVGVHMRGGRGEGRGQGFLLGAFFLVCLFWGDRRRRQSGCAGHGNGRKGEDLPRQPSLGLM